MLLQEFDISIVDRPWKDNVVADFLSQLTNNDDDSPIKYFFPNEHLFVVSTYSPWYVDIANYLAIGRIPTHLSKREKRMIIQQSARYCCIEGHLFDIGPNLEIRHCVREDEIHIILKACHDEPRGGDFSDKSNGHKALRMGYFWPKSSKMQRNMLKIVTAAR